MHATLIDSVLDENVNWLIRTTFSLEAEHRKQELAGKKRNRNKLV